MKVTKKQKAAINKIAAIFPKRHLAESHTIHQSGKDVIAAGTKELPNGIPIHPEESYTGYVRGAKNVNHAKRMESAFALAGRNGVKEYGKKMMQPTHHAEWERAVDAIFDFEEFGFAAPIELREEGKGNIESISELSDTANYQEWANKSENDVKFLESDPIMETRIEQETIAEYNLEMERNGGAQIGEYDEQMGAIITTPEEREIMYRYYAEKEQALQAE